MSEFAGLRRCEAFRTMPTSSRSSSASETLLAVLASESDERLSRFPVRALSHVARVKPEFAALCRQANHRLNPSNSRKRPV
jgi:hypothetical protein